MVSGSDDEKSFEIEIELKKLRVTDNGADNLRDDMESSDDFEEGQAGEESSEVDGDNDNNSGGDLGAGEG